MPIDIRMMIATACSVVVGVSAVVIAKKGTEAISPYSSVSEMVSPGSAPMADPIATGFQVRVAKTGLTVVVPDCAIDRYPDRFFVHVFLESSQVPPRYANLDFSLAAEKGVKLMSKGRNACSYSKDFKDLAVAEVTVGQFSSSDGTCCKILWSRNYVFDRAAGSTGNE